MEQGYLVDGEDELEDYDPMAAAAEACEAIAAVLQSPSVNLEFKQRVVIFAEARRRDLEELGNLEAASLYENVIKAGGPE